MSMYLKRTFEPGLAPDSECSDEWIETDGRGGWSSSSVRLINTRKYHGIFVTCEPELGPLVLLSSLNDFASLQSGKTIGLASHFYPMAIYPEGYRALREFSRYPLPTFRYELGEGRLEKTFGFSDESGVLRVSFRLLEAGEGICLLLKPLFAFRDVHALTRQNPAARLEAAQSGDSIAVEPYRGLPACHLNFPGASFNPDPVWYYSQRYPAERERGFDFEEDLFAVGEFSRALSPGEDAHLYISVEKLGRRETEEVDLQVERRKQRRAAELETESNRLAALLTTAAEQFLVRDSDDAPGIVAGYHWFGQWGRDTFICLPGLCCVPGGKELAREILQTWTAHLQEGLLPNRLLGRRAAPDYNSADAPLWFALALYEYFRVSGDKGFAQTVALPALESIERRFSEGTRFEIFEDDDYLLSAGAGNSSLTWMDARVAGKAITPRAGKAVELNALWYNLRGILSELYTICGRLDQADSCKDKQHHTLKSFGKAFWNEAENCLFDCVGPAEKSAQIRPNQIFALSLPFPLLDSAAAKKVLEVVERDLVTPVGLRSLSPRDSRYCGRYRGSEAERDGAYHNGTVWTWLLGPYLTAIIRYRGAEGASQAERALEGLLPEFGRGGIGSLSEIFDGDSPHSPQGCIAQAWSVFEVLRVQFLLQHRSSGARTS